MPPPPFKGTPHFIQILPVSPDVQALILGAQCVSSAERPSLPQSETVLCSFLVLHDLDICEEYRPSRGDCHAEAEVGDRREEDTAEVTRPSRRLRAGGSRHHCVFSLVVLTWMARRRWCRPVSSTTGHCFAPLHA